MDRRILPSWELSNIHFVPNACPVFASVFLLGLKLMHCMQIPMLCYHKTTNYDSKCTTRVMSIARSIDTCNYNSSVIRYGLSYRVINGTLIIGHCPHVHHTGGGKRRGKPLKVTSDNIVQGSQFPFYPCPLLVKIPFR